MNKENDLQEFLTKTAQSAQNGEFVKLALNKKASNEQEIQNIYARLVEIKGGEMLSFTYRYKTKDVISNYSIEDAIKLLNTILGKSFLNADLFTTKADYQLRYNSKYIPKMLVNKPSHTKATSKNHDNNKQRFVETNNNVYLKSLGIVDQHGEIIKSMYDKYRQIDKYIEIVDSLLNSIDLPDSLKIVDMGSGKGYLTFALYDYLTNKLGKKAIMRGVELQENLVKICNGIAQKAEFHNLEFVQGEIKNNNDEFVDILIALHACDTATDDAIYMGIKNNATLIITAPCCHKQVRMNMEIPENLRPILKNGILFERQAEILTDGLRALILEKHGYKSRVFEFISNEHTAKNLMITAIRSNTGRDVAIIDKEIEYIKETYGIKYHHLERLFEQIE